MIELKRSEIIRFIDGLNGTEASKVLTALLDDGTVSAKKMYEAAIKIAANIDIDMVSKRVFNALNWLDYDDLNARAGKTRYGYVEPSDAAWELFEEALDPFVNEMKKCQQRTLPSAAKDYCIGIIKGLWRYQEESSSEICDWFEDEPGAFVERVVDEWKEGNPDNADIAEVMLVAKMR